MAVVRKAIDKDKEASVVTESKPESVATVKIETRAKLSKKPATRKKSATSPAEVTYPTALIPATPESRVPNAKSRKRLSKAFPRPLDKKIKKETLVRDRFTFPEVEYAQFALLKKRLLVHETTAKKSELVRAGLMLLSALDDNELKALLAKVPSVG